MSCSAVFDQPLVRGLAWVGEQMSGFDESLNGENSWRCALHLKLFQDRLERFAKSIEGRSRLPNIDYAPAARHGPGNVRKYTFDRPVGESIFPPFQDHLDGFFVFGA
jgi:hypothetical protein